MGLPEHQLFPTTPRVTSEWLDGQRSLQTFDARLRVTGMAQRSARAVFTPVLEQQALQVLCVGSFVAGPRSGAEAIHAAYAPMIGSITRAMEWNEGNAQLNLLCAGVYVIAIQRRLDALTGPGQDVTTIEETLRLAETAINEYITAFQIEPVALSEVQLLLSLFRTKDHSGDKKRAIFKELREPDGRTRVFARLQKQEPET